MCYSVGSFSCSIAAFTGNFRHIGSLCAVETDTAIYVNEQKLPVCAIIAQDTYHRTCTRRYGLGSESSVTAVAHKQFVAGRVGYITVGVCTGHSKRLARLCERHIVEANQTALPVDKTLLRVFVCHDISDSDYSCVDLLGICKSVGKAMFAHRGSRHECHGRLALILSFCTKLHEAVVAAKLQAGKVDHHFLTESELGVQLRGVHGHSQCGSTVVDYKTLVHVACLIRRAYTSANHNILSVLVLAHGGHIIPVGLPIGLLDLCNGGVCLQISGWRHHRRSLEVVVAGEKRTCRHQQTHHIKNRLFHLVLNGYLY